MSTEKNRAIVSTLLHEVFKDHNIGGVDDLASETIVAHFGAVELQGREPWKQLIGQFLTAFPDIDLDLEALVAEGDLVGGRWTWTATHLGEMQGIPPTNRTVKVRGAGMYRVVDGLVVESWAQEDMAGLLMQLGVIPSPEPATA
jgi:predicted ester cyclase